MRQQFDVGDLVRITHPRGKDGIVLETAPINKNLDFSEKIPWHPDEYKCMVKLLETGQNQWVRAKWLAHLSKIS